MTDFRGKEILVARGDRVDRTDSAPQFNSIVESKAGTFEVFTASAHKLWSRSFLWLCRNRAELIELEEFISRRRGRFVPCWVPTWCADLELVEAAASGAHEITVRSSEFDPAGKHLAVITPTTIEPFTIAGVTDNLDGTQTLRLWHDVADPGLSVAIDPRAVLLSFIRYSRFSDDTVAIEFFAGGHARATLDFTEIPYEAP